ncbi:MULTISPECIES: FixH family protein [unclassified Mesorhizobium]|jgi:nitrogen fixation protein FixH|uniref:FixH family protein n=1 Tax=unclassified Mesorhizobium TaxID=325217 RepID=UPI000FE3D11E|nr:MULTISPECIES: FixH family protein [unclassified Mesorhizobium]MDG4892247.1 FixH family protein [Mesorhizobium sp. WSM4976]RWH66309.1 MAG: cytochrome oxidase [Mesorhizobium sp.]RWL20980.1 MAG: cytochrome oxidase [Mesorhizobium sp.]RWL24005.1 MAG: cytochrome oxidase [Mesorhizobium sp.]RWL28791.1 MAG: cytochrome oxidase [Mesorhizobium sp.]
MSADTQEPHGFTGKHMLIVIVSFFAVVIGVNVTMATLAETSWTGLVVENTYVASQQFNEEAKKGRAQAALGWTGKLSIASGEVRYRLVDSQGKPVPLHGVRMLFRHPAYEAEDKALTLAAPAGDSAGNTQEFAARHTPKDGVWIVEIDADAGLTAPFRDVRRVIVSNGALQ